MLADTSVSGSDFVDYDFVLIEQFIPLLFSGSAQAKHRIVTTQSGKAVGPPPIRHLDGEV